MKIRIEKGILVLFLINLLVYLPSLFEPISYGDECIYLTLGNAFRKGAVFYRDIHDNKPPLLYLVAALSGSLQMFRLLTIIWNLTHLYILYKLIEKLTTNKITPFISGLTFSFLLLIFEGRIANGEVYMMMPVTLAVYLLLTKIKRKDFLFGFSLGLLFSIGFLFKIPVFFDFVGIMFAFFFLSKKSFSIPKEKIFFLGKTKKLIGMLVGFSLPIVLSIIYYGTKGALTPYVRSALMQNIGYLSSWQGSNLGLIWRAILLIISSTGLFYWRRKIPFPLIFFFTWFSFALFGALLSGRPYPHYLIEIVPSLTILITITIDKFLSLPSFKLNRNNFLYSLFSLAAIFLLVFSYLHFEFWWYKQIPYFKNFVSFILGKINKEEYYIYWGDKTSNNYRLAEFISRTVTPQETIYVWGDAACIYAISKRQPPGRFTVNYHIFDFNGFEETIRAIEEKKPRLIIKMADEQKSWPELDSYIEKYYYRILVPQVKGVIFVRNHKLNNQSGVIAI